MKPTFLSRFFAALTELSNAEVAKQTGVNEWAQKVLFHGTKAGVRAGTVAQKAGKQFVSRFRSEQTLKPEDALKKSNQKPDRFDLTLTEEQEMMKEMLRQFGMDVMRPLAPEAEQDDWDPSEFLAQTQELGLQLIAIPEALGGAGSERSPIDHTLMIESLAYGDMGLAIAMMSPLSFINALTEFGTHEQQAKYLPLFAEEVVPAGLALLEQRAQFSPDKLKTRACRDGRGYRINGIKTLVPLCTQAEVFIVFAELDGEGPKGFIVESKAEGLTCTAERHMGLNNACMGTLELKDVWVEEVSLLGGTTGSYNHGRMIDLARMGTSALATGVSQAVVDYVITYCNERIAFGEPISHRQAVAFTIADMALELEGMRLLNWRAASRAEYGQSFHKEAYWSHLQNGEKAMMIGSNGVQMLGGAGFVCDHPVERWYRQLRAISILEGTLLV